MKVNEDFLLRSNKRTHWNLLPEELIESTIIRGQGKLTNTGALAIDTGEFTGRAPKDRFIVKDAITENSVYWGATNKAFSPDSFESLYKKVKNYLSDKELFVKDVRAGSDNKYGVNVRVICQYPWQSLFVNNMFLRLDNYHTKEFEADWKVISAPGFKADAKEDGTRQHNFAIINFTEKIILIGGTAYTGEIKKGIFSVLNFELPTKYDVLPMHCSVNEGNNGSSTVFFGLSGTGKTTLSANPEKALIGDDEHAWTNDGVFNFEGGCYAKAIDLSEDKEPEIFRAIKYGALLENIVFKENSRQVDYHDASKTMNTRVSYPINFIDQVLLPSRGGVPENIFFLCCDAYGIFPPISKLSTEQAMYHFISGYTAKVAGTEEGVNDPAVVFSACFGEPFMPLSPIKYAEMLGERLSKGKVKVWLVNTGWSGGKFGEGSRIKLKYTRALISEALKGNFDSCDFDELPIFNLKYPKVCEGVPPLILNPRNTWENKKDYDQVLKGLSLEFIHNFDKYKEVDPSFKNGGPAM